MMRFFFQVMILVWLHVPVSGQWIEQFNQTDHMPCCTDWLGDTSLFAVDEAERLQVQGAESGGTATLSRSTRCIYDATWSLDLWMDFNPSSFNYADVYLVSNVPAGAASVYGYFVRVGYSRDEVSLYRRDGNHIKKIIDGADGATARSAVEAHIEVRRSQGGRWDLYRSINTTSDSLVHEGTAVDSTYRSNNYFSVQCWYTTSRRSGFHFDNIQVTGELPDDVDKPVLDSILFIDSRHADLFFSEPLFGPVALNTVNYTISEGVGHPTDVTAFTDDPRHLRLTFREPLQAGVAYTVTISNISDVLFNMIGTIVEPIVYRPPYQAGYRDVVINEILADPVPPAGLPDHEYVELFNATGESIHLGGWKLAGAGEKRIPEGSFLQPGGFLMVVNEADLAYWQGAAVSWGTGALLNGGESLALVDNNGAVIDSLHYGTGWYDDPQKSEGGWSLEHKNPYHCSSDSSNWSVSAAEAGGTPLRPNSVYDPRPDSRAPQLVSVRSTGAHGIALLFDEWVDGASLRPGAIQLTPPVPVQTVGPGETAHAVVCALGMPLAEKQLYGISVSEVADCSGNTISTSQASLVHDGIPPAVEEVIVFSNYKAGILFSERIAEAAVRSRDHFVLMPDAVLPTSTDLQSDSLVILEFAAPKTVAGDYVLEIFGMQDIAGNIGGAESIPFSWVPPPPLRFNQLIISEIMADPHPVVGLPAAEFLEFYNPGHDRLLASDLRLDVGQKSRTISAIALEAGQHVVLCPATSGGLFKTGNKIRLSNWLSITNRGDTLSIYSEEGQIIFNTRFDQTWYRSEQKSAGGWSLEMVDPGRPCGGKSNWSASTHPSGGTPADVNSVNARHTDLRGPAVLTAIAGNAREVYLHFNEKLHPASVPDAAIRMEPQVGDLRPVLSEPLLDEIVLTTAHPLDTGTEYSIFMDNFSDCQGNIIERSGRQATVILPSASASFDVVLNEVLYDPRFGGVEFVELYNRSGKYIDLKNWIFALEREGVYYRKKVVLPTHMLLKPEAFLVLTPDPYTLKADYPQGELINFYNFTDMPPLSDEGSTLAVLNADEVLIDRFAYHPGLHHPWLDDPEGVSLERIRTESPTDDAANWTSAAQDHAYATPGLRNSQFSEEDSETIRITVEPAMIIPGSGGPQSRMTLSYICSVPGIMANISVFDISGYCVKKIAQNANLGREGAFEWYGRDMDGAVVDLGYYIVLLEMFGTDGSVRHHKQTIVVARDCAY